MTLRQLFGAITLTSRKHRPRPGAGSAPVFLTNPSIIGTPAVGVPLRFTAGTVAGAPLAMLSTQWLRDGASIVGATNLSYTPVADDAGHLLAVRQTAWNDYGAANATSAGVILPIAPSVTTGPSIIGIPTIGLPTTYTAGTYAGAPTPTVTRQWSIAGAPVNGATGSSFTPTDREGSALTVTETASNSAGSVYATSAGVLIISQGGAVAAPDYTSVDAVQPGFLSPLYAHGDVATVDFGEPVNGATSYDYQFYRDGVAIGGSSGTAVTRTQIYTTVLADAGTILSVAFTPNNGFGAGVLTYVEGVYVD